MADYSLKPIPCMIDDRAKLCPTQCFAMVTKSNGIDQGLQAVTYRSIANAVNRASYWLDSNLGKPGHKEFPTFAYVGPLDLGYPIMLLAAIKTHRKMFSPSPYLSDEGFEAMLAQINCQDFISPKSFGTPRWMSLTKSIPGMKNIEMPNPIEWLQGCEVSEYQYDYIWAEVADQPIGVFHSSGSTGLPKPLIHTHASVATLNVRHYMKSSDPEVNFMRLVNHKVYVAFHPAHLAGMAFVLFWPVYLGMVPVLGPSDVVPSINIAKELARSNHITAVAFPSLVMEQLVHESIMTDILPGVTHVVYAGFPLLKATGDILAKHFSLISIYGSTETLGVITYTDRPQEWEYFQVHACSGVEFVYRTRESYELVWMRKDGCAQAIFKVIPELDFYYSGDLFMEHPERSGYWKYYGRLDDLLILSSGYHTYVSQMEGAVRRHPDVQDVIIGGQSRLKPFLLIEPKANGGILPSLSLDTIWPDVEKANMLSTKELQLSRALTMFTKPEKPFVISSKGTLNRIKTIELYEAEVDTLYKEHSPQLDELTDVPAA